MAKKIYSETVKNWIKVNSIATGTLIGGIFLYLTVLGSITPTGYSKDMICAGTLEDPCYAYINFTTNEDIFIYPTEYDPYGRNTTFEFNPNVKSWYLQRSWGDGWRTIPLNQSCQGTWCGLSNKEDKRVFSVAFRKGKSYQIRIVAFKNNPSDEIKWSAFDEIDPKWLSTDSSNLEYTDNYETRYKEVKKVIEEVIGTKEVPILKNITDEKGTHEEVIGYKKVNITKFVDVVEKVPYQSKEGLKVKDKVYLNSFVKNNKLIVFTIPIGDRNLDVFGECREYEKEKGVCSEIIIK